MKCKGVGTGVTTGTLDLSALCRWLNDAVAVFLDICDLKLWLGPTVVIVACWLLPGAQLVRPVIWCQKKVYISNCNNSNWNRHASLGPIYYHVNISYVEGAAFISNSIKTLQDLLDGVNIAKPNNVKYFENKIYSQYEPTCMKKLKGLQFHVMHTASDFVLRWHKQHS